MTNKVESARELVKTVEETGKIFALTHNYTGYPMVRQAREIIGAGEIGDILAIRSSYIQGWLTTFDSTFPLLGSLEMTHQSRFRIFGRYRYTCL